MAFETQKISQIYAKALFGLAPDGYKSVYKSLQEFLKLLDGSQDLSLVLCTEVFSAEERNKVLGKILDTLGATPELKHFLTFVSDKGRFNTIQEIFLCFEQEMYQKENTICGQVSSSTDLNSNEVSQLTKAFETKLNKKVVFSFKKNSD